MATKSPKSPTFPGPLTARGAVLAVLLSDSDQSGNPPLQGRTSLAAIIKSLKRKYHWPVEVSSFPSNGADGRATWATVYSLPAACLLYTSPSPRDATLSRMPSSA